MIDIHNHILINADDGPKSEEEALTLLLQAENAGITDIIMTPHHYSGDFENPGEKVMEMLSKLNKAAKRSNVHINLYPGQEIRINPNLLYELLSGKSITLNDSRYVLMEFSYLEIADYADQLIFDLQMNGFVPVIAHPERFASLINNLEELYKLVDKGVLIQITAGSVTGLFGNNLKALTLKMIRQNIVHVVASDAHDAVKRPFMLLEAYKVIETELGTSYVDYLKDNAKAILNNEEVTVMSPERNDFKHEFKKQKRKSLWGLF